MKALAMNHLVDPREEIFAALGTSLDGVGLVQPVSVLICMYERPDTTASGIILTDKHREEDRYQGKCGLVLAMGAMAFKDDEDHQWGEDRPKVGDWVMVRVGDTFPFMINERTCRLVHEKDVRLVLPHPDLVY